MGDPGVIDQTSLRTSELRPTLKRNNGEKDLNMERWMDGSLDP